MKVLPFTIPAVENFSFLIQEDKLEGFYPHLHRHKEVQICWIKKGRGTLVVQAELFAFKEEDIFVIASNKAHLFKKEHKGNIQTISLFFDLSARSNPLMSLPEMNDLAIYYSRLVPCNKLEHLITAEIGQKLNAIMENSSSHKLALFIELLASLKTALSTDDHVDVVYSEKDGDRMKMIMDYTLSNFKNNIGISDIAKEISYTPEAFCRFFKKRTRKTFIQYLNELRINEACHQIIGQQDRLMSEIAYGSGFNNVSHFNRVFKQLKQMSPLQYRRTYGTNYSY